MNLLNITIRLSPRGPGDKPVEIVIDPLDGTSVRETCVLYPSEIDLINAINNVLKQRKHHIQPGEQQ